MRPESRDPVRSRTCHAPAATRPQREQAPPHTRGPHPGRGNRRCSSSMAYVANHPRHRRAAGVGGKLTVYAAFPSKGPEPLPALLDVATVATSNPWP